MIRPFGCPSGLASEDGNPHLLDMNRLALACLTLALVAPLRAQESDQQVILRFFCITDDLVGWQGANVGRIQPDAELQRFLATYRGYEDVDGGGLALVKLRSLESEVFALRGVGSTVLYESLRGGFGEVVDSTSFSIVASRLIDRRPWGVFSNSTNRFHLYGPPLLRTVDGESPHHEGDFTWMFTNNVAASDYLARGRCEMLDELP